MLTWLTGVTLVVTVLAMWGDWWWLFGAGCVGLLGLFIRWVTSFGNQGWQAVVVLVGTGMVLSLVGTWWTRSFPEGTIFHPVIFSHLLALIYTGLGVSLAVWRWGRGVEKQ
ncbi:hypothetical protein [Corynebacterium nasicanis]|uniref:Uncharacterized protein n=1 Tax=Corynebacterium nasicanis TaxID=1448267 RepID=A0ABW1QG63_9CORY